MVRGARRPAGADPTTLFHLQVCRSPLPGSARRLVPLRTGDTEMGVGWRSGRRRSCPWRRARCQTSKWTALVGERCERLLIFVVAYYAESTLRSVLERIPRSIFDRFDCHVLVVDDASEDRTFAIGREYQS